MDPALRPALGGITVRVTDDGSPRLSDARSFTVTVAAPARCWSARSGSTPGRGRDAKLIGVRARLQRTARRGGRVGRRAFPGHPARSHAGFQAQGRARPRRSYDPASRSIRLTLVRLVARKPLTVTATGLVGARRHAGGGSSPRPFDHGAGGNPGGRVGQIDEGRLESDMTEPSACSSCGRQILRTSVSRACRRIESASRGRIPGSG